jgi:hypothetical protein
VHALPRELARCAHRWCPTIDVTRARLCRGREERPLSPSPRRVRPVGSVPASGQLRAVGTQTGRTSHKGSAQCSLRPSSDDLPDHRGRRDDDRSPQFDQRLELTDRRGILVGMTPLRHCIQTIDWLIGAGAVERTSFEEAISIYLASAECDCCAQNAALDVLKRMLIPVCDRKTEAEKEAARLAFGCIDQRFRALSGASETFDRT